MACKSELGIKILDGHDFCITFSLLLIFFFSRLASVPKTKYFLTKYPLLQMQQSKQLISSTAECGTKVRVEKKKYTRVDMWSACYNLWDLKGHIIILFFMLHDVTYSIPTLFVFQQIENNADLIQRCICPFNERYEDLHVSKDSSAMKNELSALLAKSSDLRALVRATETDLSRQQEEFARYIFHRDYWLN